MGAAEVLVFALAAALASLGDVGLLVQPVGAALQAQPSSLQLRRGPIADCPVVCVCSTWLSLLRASCTGHRLYSIHTGVSSIVQALDLSNNSISQLEDRQLSRAGLTRLKYLNLSMNAINEIGLNAFDDLKNLTVLDLSNNHLDFIGPDTFFYNLRLRILHLAGNKFNLHVPKLHSTSLTELDLSGCRINYLMKDTFDGLIKLRKLDLSNNAMVEMDKEVLRAMPYLRNLSLGRNYWSCDGAMYNLKVYMRSRSIRTDPICEKPALTTKFEKIIALKTISATETQDEPKPAKKLPEPRNTAKDPWDVDSWRELEEAVQEQEEDQQLPADSGSSGIFSSALNNVSPFWFLLIGFLLGSGATMVVTYLWLSTTISCLIPRIRRAEAADSADVSSQRVSLLRHLWQQENMSSSEDSSSGGGGGGGNAPTTSVLQAAAGTTPSCPGTPPPPYREVMLHRNLYPRAAMAAAAQQQTSGRLFVATAPISDAPTAATYTV